MKLIFMNKILIENYINEAISWIDLIDSNSLARMKAKEMMRKAFDLVNEEDESQEVVVINALDEKREDTDNG